LARALAGCTYKSAELFEERFARKPDRRGGNPWASGHDRGLGLMGERFDVAGYLDYQGERFIDRFDANSYLAITRTMDTFDPTPGLNRIQAEVVLVGISSDWLFPTADIAAMAARMTEDGVSCHYRELISAHGHDAFLAEPDLLAELVGPFI
jgi:homoserine O-acetyltransferase/O-succinyltransferase